MKTQVSPLRFASVEMTHFFLDLSKELSFYAACEAMPFQSQAYSKCEDALVWMSGELV